MLVIIGSCIHWLKWMFIHWLSLPMFIKYEFSTFAISCFVSYVMSFSLILLIIFLLLILLRANNIIYLLPSVFTISLKLLKFTGKIIYFCLPNLNSKSCLELMGHFILSNKWIIILPFLIFAQISPEFHARFSSNFRK